MTTFSDLITHTRASTATYVDANGVLQTAAVDEPRVNHHIYDGVRWVNEGILHESEARTNLNADSNSFTASGNVTLTQNSAVSPDGTVSAALVEDNAASNSNAALFTPSSPTAGNNVTSSIFLKYASGSGWVAFVHRSSSSQHQFFAWFDILNGVVGSNEAGSGSMTYIDHGIEDWGNGWYRCFTVGRDSTYSAFSGFITSAGSDGDKSRETGNDVYIWENQVELASKPSSPIPTAGSQVTRAGDSMTIPAAKLPYDATNMSIAMEGLETFADLDAAGQVTLYDWRVDANNRVTLTLDTDSTKVGTLTLTMANGGSTATISTTAELTPGINDPFNVAIVATSNELGIALDGTAETRVSHTIGLPDLETSDATLSGMGTRSLVRAWNDDITNAGEEEATS